ncbi:hypothetical protein AXF42_Ash020056 [Apostasia shenzhenica]|uniref:Uncharacterized protein n=1 Tax=Apostasia shenzhenica TaxID=1088818 RepID=A0A2I0B4R5_9ASPA|nr:hypothetical protein AXF42_Ash020056 [Apostasia shenzhenica]
MGSPGGLRTVWIIGFLLVTGEFIPRVRGVVEATIAGRGRSLLGFRETFGNVSFECSPSGPCLPCQYSEKNDEKFRCSETGYRLPLKCVEITGSSNGEHKSKNLRKLLFRSDDMDGFVPQRKLVAALTNFTYRRLMDDSSKSGGGKQSYTTYRSCVPADGEEKLSVFGFELIMVCLLLVAGPVVYLRQKRPIVVPGTGAMRIPTNSPRF